VTVVSARLKNFRPTPLSMTSFAAFDLASP
jgi:hypothetical protein